MGELVEIVANTPKLNFIKVAKNRHEIYTGPFFGPFDIYLGYCYLIDCCSNIIYYFDIKFKKHVLLTLFIVAKFQ